MAAGHDSVAALSDALSLEDLGVQSHAAAALGRIGDMRVLPGLAGVLRQHSRSPAGYDGPVEAARAVGEALKAILRRSAASLSEEELRGLSDLPDAAVETPSPADPHRTLDETVVDCAPVRALVQRELSRRLEWS